MDVGVEADIVQLGIGTKRYESDRKKRWFTVFLRGNLIDGLKDVEVLDTQEYHNGKFQKDNALDQFLVPYIYSASLEENADDFTDFYCSGAEYDGYRRIRFQSGSAGHRFLMTCGTSRGISMRQKAT